MRLASLDNGTQTCCLGVKFEQELHNQSSRSILARTPYYALSINIERFMKASLIREHALQACMCASIPMAHTQLMLHCSTGRLQISEGLSLAKVTGYS